MHRFLPRSIDVHSVGDDNEVQGSSFVFVFVVVVHLVGSHRLRAFFCAHSDSASSTSGSILVRNGHQTGLAIFKVIVLLAHPHELLVCQVIAVVDLLADSVTAAVFLLLFCSFGLNILRRTA
jgi:hypothetical protein